MRSRGAKALSILLILSMAVGFTGTAAGSPWIPEQFGDELCKYQLTVFLAPYCADQLESEISSTRPSEVQFDIYTNWAVNHDTIEQVLTNHKSGLNSSFGLAMAKAKLIIIESRNNGTTEAKAQQTAIERIDQYYTAQQISTLAPQEREVIRFNKTLKHINETDALLNEDVLHYNFPYCYERDPNAGYSFYKSNVTLYNGSTRTYTGLNANGGSGYDHYTCGLLSPSLGGDAGNVKVTSGTGKNVTILQGPEFQKMLTQIDNERTTARNNIVNMTQYYYQNYDQGEINTSNQLGPLETLITASTNYQNTGSYSYLALTEAQAGYASNRSYAFQVQWNNTGDSQKTAWGQLFVGKDAFNGTLEVNKTYNASGETVIFVHNTDDGKATKTDLNGNFKILKMRNTETGDSINRTTVQQTRFYTDGVQDMKKQLADARQSRDHYTKCSSCGGGAIIDPGNWLSDLFSGLPDIPGGVAGVVGIVAAILLILIAVSWG